MKSKTHRIAIPSILETGTDSVKRLGYLLQREGFDQIVLCYDMQIKDLFGYEIEEILNIHSIGYETLILDSVDFCSVTQKAFDIPDDTEAFVGLGGGKVLDAAKYMAFIRKLPFISIPTSTSNDGFSSPVASLMIQERRTTVPAKIPYGIIVDTHIISTAPEKFIFSGIGDLVSNITALWDWKFEEENAVGKVEDFAYMISQKSVNSFMNLQFQSIKDPNFLQELVDSLTMNGIAMEISGSSAPASGGEHLISHAMDKILVSPYLHGIQVGIASYLMSILQENRSKDIYTLFDKTGFWSHVESLRMDGKILEQAIDLAPTIKKQRYTFLHLQENRNRAKEILRGDDVLKRLCPVL